MSATNKKWLFYTLLLIDIRGSTTSTFYISRKVPVKIAVYPPLLGFYIYRNGTDVGTHFKLHVVICFRAVSSLAKLH
jgi:hypothetical protein